MTQATLYIGLNDKDEKRQTMETVEAYKIVQSELVRHVGGGTIYAAEGIYTHDDGTIVVEKTLKSGKHHHSPRIRGNGFRLNLPPPRAAVPLTACDPADGHGCRRHKKNAQPARMKGNKK